MPIALRPEATWYYQLQEDRLEGGKVDPQGTTFRLKALSVRDEAELQDSLSATAGEGGEIQMHMRTGSQALKVLEVGLVGWTHFRDEDGNEIEFPRTKKGCDVNRLGVLSTAHRDELHRAILEHNRVEVPEQD